ncbi:MAG: hypothetical protein ABEN55_16230 [Bradymonadaceae bacterium]
MPDELTWQAEVLDKATDTLDKVDDRLERLEGGTHEVDEEMEKASSTADEYGSVLAGAAGGAMAEVADRAIEMAGQVAQAQIEFTKATASIERNADAAGVSAEKYQSLEFAFQRVGLEGQDMQEGLNTIAERAFDARDGAQGMIDDFGSLGIEVEQLRGKGPAELFELVTKRIGETEDATTAAKGATSLLGDELATKLLPRLRENSDMFEDLTRQAEKTGNVLDQNTIQQAERAEKAWNRMTESGRGLAKTLQAEMLPALTEVSQATVKTSRAFQTAIKRTTTFFGQTASLATGGPTKQDAQKRRLKEIRGGAGRKLRALKSGAIETPEFLQKALKARQAELAGDRKSTAGIEDVLFPKQEDIQNFEKRNVLANDLVDSLRKLSELRSVPKAKAIAQGKVSQGGDGAGPSVSEVQKRLKALREAAASGGGGGGGGGGDGGETDAERAARLRREAKKRLAVLQKETELEKARANLQQVQQEVQRKGLEGARAKVKILEAQKRLQKEQNEAAKKGAELTKNLAKSFGGPLAATGRSLGDFVTTSDKEKGKQKVRDARFARAKAAFQNPPGAKKARRTPDRPQQDSELEETAGAVSNVNRAFQQARPLARGLADDLMRMSGGLGSVKKEIRGKQISGALDSVTSSLGGIQGVAKNLDSGNVFGAISSGIQGAFGLFQGIEKAVVTPKERQKIRERQRKQEEQKRKDEIERLEGTVEDLRARRSGQEFREDIKQGNLAAMREAQRQQLRPVVNNFNGNVMTDEEKFGRIASTAVNEAQKSSM